jgi:hypothetical protein
MADRLFILWPDGRIEEVDDEGDTYDYPSEPGLYDDLVKAGYPLSGDTVGSGTWDGIIDLRVEDGARVIVHSTGRARGEHDMGPASELFLAWLRRADQDDTDSGS